MTAGAAAGGAAAAAAAAAAHARRLRAEEEEMTPYAPQDLDGWEFKILRANTQRFRDPHELRRVLAEEAEAGWELVEKFDDHRLRLKRRTECRERDSQLLLDPYRTWVGMSNNALAWIILGATVGVLVCIGVLAALLH